MKRLQVDLHGPLVYGDFGGEGRPPAVLLHGIGGAKVNWLLFAPLLAQRFHVLALDLPGFGESALAGRSAGLADQRDLVVEFLEQHIDGPVLLVGHSMGGLIAAMVAASRGDLVRGLVLFDPAFPPTEETPAPGVPVRLLDRLSDAPTLFGRLGQVMVRSRGAAAVVTDTLRRTSVDFSALPADFVQAHIDAEAARMRQPGSYIGYMQGWQWFHRNFGNVAPLEAMIRSISVRTLLLHGEQDRVISQGAARRLAELQPGWTTHFLANIGHNPNFEAPDTSVALLWDWLGKATPSPS